jgi:hypothetical protein
MRWYVVYRGRLRKSRVRPGGARWVIVITERKRKRRRKRRRWKRSREMLKRML